MTLVSIGWHLMVLLLLSSQCHVAAASPCHDRLSRLRNAKQPGSRRFAISFSENPTSYSPGQVYTVVLSGWRSRYLADRFTDFQLSVADDVSNSSWPDTAGMFVPLPGGVARPDLVCPGSVTQKSSAPKAEARVLWKAPPPAAGSKCIRFSAMVAMSRHSWFMDAGNLTRILCQAQPRTAVAAEPAAEPAAETAPSLVTDRHIGRPGNGALAPDDTAVNRGHPRDDDLPRTGDWSDVPGSYDNGSDSVQSEGSASSACCPCADVHYQMKFDGLWSRTSHPRHFPRMPHLNHFSDILVASHSSKLEVWKQHSLASGAVQRVAEFGDISLLSRQLRENRRHVKTVSRAAGLWYPHVQGSSTSNIAVDSTRPYVSLISMLGPSPDWIVGVSSLSMCTESCEWLKYRTLPLSLFDAGTDSGLLYNSGNSATRPPEPIREINNTWPPGSPFYDPDGPAVAPFARVTLTKVEEQTSDCHLAAVTGRLRQSTPDVTEMQHHTSEQCATSAWSAWSQCSVACGPGVMSRRRHYLTRTAVLTTNCTEQLIQKKYCDNVCDGAEAASGAAERACEVTAWSEWSPCSASCGSGTRTRWRTYINRVDSQLCNLDNNQKKSCVGAVSTCSDEQVEEGCAVSSWSTWSPCSSQCGDSAGSQTRYRRLLPRKNTTPPPPPPQTSSFFTSSSTAHSGSRSGPDSDRAAPHCRQTVLNHSRSCWPSQSSCRLTSYQAKRACSLPMDSGSCRGVFWRFYYDKLKRMCVPFTYSGCRGNRNNFRDVTTCQTTCQAL